MAAVRTIRLLGAAALAAGLVLPATRASGQQAPASFEALATADGVRVLVEVPGFPLTANIFDGGAPVTQAKVNGLGESVGYASMPYPSENLTTLPGMLLPLVGLPALPSYPLTARSEAGSAPEARVGEGPLLLEAESSPRASTARSVTGGAAGLVNVGTVTSEVEAALDEAGAVTSSGRSTVEALTVPGLLRVGAAESTARAERPASGELRAESSFLVDGLTVAGVTVGVDDEGIRLPGQTAPVPDTEGLSPVLDAAGISMRYLEQVETEGGVVSAGLSISVPVQSPLGAPATATYILGRTSASVSAVHAPAVSAPPVPVGSPGGAPTVGAGSPSTSGTGPGSLAGGPVAAPDLSSTGAPTVAPGGTSGGTTAPVRPAGSVIPEASTAATVFYLTLVLGGLVALTGSFLVRTIGVRLLWTR